jgi:hypothetical protein
MHTKKQFLIKFYLIENELREHLEISRLKKDKDEGKIIIKHLKEVKEIRSIIRDDLIESSK